MPSDGSLCACAHASVCAQFVCARTHARAQCMYVFELAGAPFIAKAHLLPLHPVVGLDTHAPVCFNLGQVMIAPPFVWSSLPALTWWTSSHPTEQTPPLQSMAHWSFARGPIFSHPLSALAFPRRPSNLTCSERPVNCMRAPQPRHWDSSRRSNVSSTSLEGRAPRTGTRRAPWLQRNLSSFTRACTRCMMP